MQMTDNHALAGIVRETARPHACLHTGIVRKTHDSTPVLRGTIRRLATVLRVKNHVSARERQATAAWIPRFELLRIRLGGCQRSKHSLSTRPMRNCRLDSLSLRLQINSCASSQLRAEHLEILVDQLAIAADLHVRNVESTFTATKPLLAKTLLQEQELPSICPRNATNADGQIVRLEPSVGVRPCAGLLRQRHGGQSFVAAQPHLSPDFLSGVELNGRDLGQNAGTPKLNLALDSLHLAVAQLGQESARHRVQQPQVQVRVDAATPLRLHRPEIRPDATERADGTRRRHPVGSSAPSAPRHNADHVLQEQLQHQIGHQSLRDGIRGDATKHLLRGRHRGRVLFQQPPATDVRALVHQRHHEAAGVGDVRRHEHERRAKQNLVAHADVSQSGAMRVRPHHVRVADQHAAQSALDFRRDLIARHGVLQPGTFAKNIAGLNQLRRIQLSKVVQRIRESLLTNIVSSTLDDRLAPPQAILSGEQISMSSPARHR